MTTVRVLYADTDMAGVVYHANYLRFFELARTEQLSRLGCNVAELHVSEGILFTISEVALQYHRPARYGDLLAITVRTLKVGPVRFTLAYDVTAHGREGICVTGHTTIAALDVSTGRPVRLPTVMRQRLVDSLAAHEEDA